MECDGVTAGKVALLLGRGDGPGPAPRTALALVVVASPLLTGVLLSRWAPVAVALAGAPLLVRRPDLGAILVFPLSLAAAVWGLTGATLAAIGALTLAVVFRVAVGDLSLRRPHWWISGLACLLLISYALPAAAVPVPGQSRVVDLLGILAGLALLAVTVAAPPDARRLARAMAVSGALAAAYALTSGDYVGERLQALGQNPNFLGALLALPLVAAVGLARVTRRPTWLLPAAVCGAATVETQSRGAFIAAGVGVAVVVVQSRPRIVQALIAIAVGAIVATSPGLVGDLEHVAARDRASAELRHDSILRRHAAEFAATVAAEHPIRGIGFATFPSYAVADPRFGLYMVTHNDYLRLAAEDGAVTLLVFLGLLWPGVRGRRAGEPGMLRAVVVTYAVGLLFANALADLIASIPFWLSLGCLLAADHGRAGRTRPAVTPLNDRGAAADGRHHGGDSGRRTLRVRQ